MIDPVAADLVMDVNTTRSLLASALLWAGCFSPTDPLPEMSTMDGADGREPVDEDDGPRILSARVSEELTPIRRVGDLWMSTWAEDGAVYFTWGDGTGSQDCLPSEDGVVPKMPAVEAEPGCFVVEQRECECEGCCEVEDLVCSQVLCYEECHAICPFTDTGILRLDGELPAFGPCEDEDQCVVARHVPAIGLPEYYPVPQPEPGKNDKPSSLLALDGKLVLSGHRPAGEPTEGFLAYSEDGGSTWTEIEGSPWGAQSNFRVAMFINMGQAYGLNDDGYVYAFGVPREAAAENLVLDVHLARVERDAILDYAAYEYYAGRDDDDAPQWAQSEADAVPIPGLETMEQASAIYHEGIGRYLFLSSQVDPELPNAGALFEAPTPWGPWVEVAEVLEALEHPTWLGGQYIAGLITKGAGDRHVYFTVAGGIESYNLNVGRIDFEVRSPG